MISERELWACAHEIMLQHGGRVVEHLADKVRELARAGDAAGVKTWLAIADRVDRLADIFGTGEARH